MFYATTFNEICDRGVIDAQGKRLAFIGNLPVQVGDTVFTDGNIIFGNSTPRGSALNFFFENKGIPVLGVDLRGYITLLGGFKSYPITGDDWIVNSQKYYAHDDGEENIIDTEISFDTDGEADGVFTAEKSVQQNSELPADDLFSQLPEYTAFCLSADDCDFCKYGDTILKDCEIIQCKDNQVIEQIAMAEIIEPYETAVSEIAASVVVPNRAVEEELDLSNMGLPANLLARLDNISSSLFGAYSVVVSKIFFTPPSWTATARL